jgi:uncharacterized protein
MDGVLRPRAAFKLQAVRIFVAVAVFGLCLPAGADTMSDAEAAWRRQDYATAAELYRSLAEQGRATAQHALAKMYENGEGLPRNSVEAAKWFLRAAEQGHAGAQLFLGGMYETGDGVQRDYVRAYMWFSLSLAAGQGDFAARGRSDVMERMTPAQIAQGDRLVHEWKPRKE